MKKMFAFILIGLFFISCVSAYYCVQQEDNKEIKEFKSKVNMLALQEDINNGITQEGFLIKLKYFNPCKEW